MLFFLFKNKVPLFFIPWAREEHGGAGLFVVLVFFFFLRDWVLLSFGEELKRKGKENGV